MSMPRAAKNAAAAGKTPRLGRDPVDRVCRHAVKRAVRGEQHGAVREGAFRAGLEAVQDGARPPLPRLRGGRKLIHRAAAAGGKRAATTLPRRSVERAVRAQSELSKGLRPIQAALE